MTETASYDAVVFDMDGIIFDSEREVMECWLAVAEKYGVAGFREPYLRCIGTTKARTKQILQEAFGEDFPYEQYASEESAMFHAKNDGGRLPLKPGVREILAFLKQEGKKIGLASSTRRSTVIAELRDAGILPFFDAVITGESVQHSKPAPDSFLLACEALGADPSRSFAIEDSHNGIRAAHAGHLRPVMVPDLLPVTAEMEDLAEVILGNLLEVIDYLRQNGARDPS